MTGERRRHAGHGPSRRTWESDGSGHVTGDPQMTSWSDDLAADVVVVGAGNAAMCAALAARERARVIVLERATEIERGGNTAFTAGAMRVAYDGVEELRRADARSVRRTEMSPPTSATTPEAAVLRRTWPGVTEYRTDPDLVETAGRPEPRDPALDGDQGGPLRPDLRTPGVQGRWSVQVLGRADRRGLRRRAGPGRGLDADRRRRRDRGPLRRPRGAALIADDDGRPRRPRQAGRRHRATFRASAVVLAAGGFQANTEWRTRYLGPGWDLAKVRGTRFNTGDGLRMALDIGRHAARHWSGCHAVRLGPQRARVRRPGGRRRLPEAQLSVRDHGQRRGRALPRRGRRLPQLHLRQVRPRDPGPAPPVRLAGLRRQGRPPAARRVPHPRR